MRTVFHGSVCGLFVAVAVLVAPRAAAAAPVTYTEKIEDLNFFTFLDLFDTTRDLTRTQTFGDGSSAVETDDATIVSQNMLSDNWGLSTAIAPIAWQHLFAPTIDVDTFVSGKLTLEVIGVDADFPDFVFVEFFPVAALTVGGMDTLSTTIISTDGILDADALMSFVLADGQLNVMTLPLLLDFMTIRSSLMEVTYEPVAAPEPATAVLLLSGLAAGAWRRRGARAGIGRTRLT